MSVVGWQRRDRLFRIYKKHPSYNVIIFKYIQRYIQNIQNALVEGSMIYTLLLMNGCGL